VHARLSHAGLHAAEGNAYRFIVLEAVARIGLQLTLAVEAELRDLVCGALGVERAQLAALLAMMGRRVGPPWTQREKSAALAAWLALAAQ
jgi:hypothetical protein